MIGDREVRVRATSLALLFYRQEFKSDLLADLSKLIDLKAKDSEVDIEQMMERFDLVTIYQIVWAMAKADAFGKGEFPSFFKWFAELDSASLYDADVLGAVMEEAQEGFFRPGVKGAIKQRK